MNLQIHEEVDRVLGQIEATGNFDAGFEYINAIMDVGKGLDQEIGKLVIGMEKLWVPSEHEGEKFLDAAIRKTELSPDTVNRHMAINAFFLETEIPEHVLPIIKDAGQKSLIRIAKAVTKHEFTTESWEKIAESTMGGEKSVGLVLQKITKTEPRSNWLFITWDDRGVLTAHAKDKETGEMVHVEIGRLHKNNKNPIVQKAITRIVTNADIKDKVEY